MMNLDYYVANPTGNITYLVKTPILILNQPKVAAELMAENPVCEQVGFLFSQDNECDIRLRMAAGEFCGNATMSTAAVFCKENNLQDGEERIVRVKTSGVKQVLNVRIKRDGEEYLGEVCMPQPTKIRDVLFKFEGHNYLYPVVEFPGISHVIIEDEMSIYMAEKAIKQWCETLHAEGLGLMMIDETKTRINPLVYVPKINSLFWESSCASGTTSVGAYYRKKEGKPLKMSFREPGGVLTIEAKENGDLILGGRVYFEN